MRSATASGATGRSAMQRPGHCRRPRRKRKQVQIAEGQALAPAPASSSNSAPVSPGKPTITSNAQSQFRPAGAHQRIHLFHVMPRPIAPVHPPQHSVRPRLQGQVRVASKPRHAGFWVSKLRHQPNQLASPIHRLNRAEPQPRQSWSARRSPAPCPPESVPVGDPDKSLPHRPRLIPESTSSLPPAATNPSTCLRTLAAGRLLEGASRSGDHAKRTAIAAPFWILEVGPGLRARAPSLRLFKKGMCKPVVGPDGKPAPRQRSAIPREPDHADCELHSSAAKTASAWGASAARLKPLPCNAHLTLATRAPSAMALEK